MTASTSSSSSTIAKSQTDLVKAQFLDTMNDEFLAAMLQGDGIAVTEVSLADARKARDVLLEKSTKSFEKNLAKSLEKAEGKADVKSQPLDPSTVLAHASRKAAGKAVEKIQKNVDFVEGSCGHCHLWGLYAADQNKTLKKCGKCMTAMYCSRECQVAHWPAHKQACKLQSAKETSKQI